MTLTQIRHDLHAHPQVRYEETYASALIQRELTALGIEFKAGLAKGTGVLGYLPATMDSANAPTIALRADMDALPIHEETGKPYASTIPGRMHACGHDGHTTILIGVARKLAATEHRPNNVLFVFQPAEEGGAGGKMMVDEGCLNGSLLGKKADFMFGLHGWSSVKLGHVATKVGSLMASTDDFRIEYFGQGGHAAAPETTNDPIMPLVSLITSLQTIASRNVDPFDQVVVTVGQVHAGTTHNIIPMSGFVQGTIRAMNAETRELACQRVRTIAEGVALAFGVKADIKVSRGYPIVINDPTAVARFLNVARETLGEGFVTDEGKPTMGGEDFAFYGTECPSCFYQLGLIPENRNDYENVHTPVFDFNDDAIEVGVRIMTALALSTD